MVQIPAYNYVKLCITLPCAEKTMAHEDTSEEISVELETT